MEKTWFLCIKFKVIYLSIKFKVIYIYIYPDICEVSRFFSEAFLFYLFFIFSGPESEPLATPLLQHLGPRPSRGRTVAHGDCRIYGGFHSHGGTQKWMVFVRENPIVRNG